MFWIAKKSDETLVALTEKEALTHFKNNNIASRMRLEFIGTSDGKTYAQKRTELMEEHQEELQQLKGNGEQPVSPKFLDLLNRIEQEALGAEAEVARVNGVTTPDRGLDVLIHGEGMDAGTMQRARNQLKNIAYGG